MRPINSENDRFDWRHMEDRLRRVEDALISVQTIVNLLMDLLERAIPLRDEEDRDKTGGNDEI